MPCLVDNCGTPALLWIKTGCGHSGEVVGELGESMRKNRGKAVVGGRKGERGGGGKEGAGREGERILALRNLVQNDCCELVANFGFIVRSLNNKSTNRNTSRVDIDGFQSN